jgi:hypothetical protein
MLLSILLYHICHPVALLTHLFVACMVAYVVDGLIEDGCRTRQKRF